jgi:hypothetical protein
MPSLRQALSFGLCLAAALTACQTAGMSAPAAPSIAAPRATPTADVRVLIAPSIAQAATAAPAPAPLEILSLGAGQYISARGSYTDTETLAAGPMLCHIERGSPAFQHLVLYPAGTVIFSDSGPAPYKQEDELMHPAAVLPLSRLEALVRQEWGSAAHIMVNAGYDSLMAHDIAQANPALKYSLHFEGRSLDVIPWPPNLGRLARLCALAHAAGFDWVHNEGDHCHMSVMAESLCPLGSQAPP